MEFIMNVLFTTGWGAAIVGILIFIAIIVHFLDNKNPKI